MLTVRNVILIAFNVLSLFVLGIGKYYSTLFTLEVIAISLGTCVFLQATGRLGALNNDMKEVYLRFSRICLMIIYAMFLLLSLISPLETILPFRQFGLTFK